MLFFNSLKGCSKTKGHYKLHKKLCLLISLWSNSKFMGLFNGLKRINGAPHIVNVTDAIIHPRKLPRIVRWI